MKEIIAYKMSYTGTLRDKSTILCVPFEKKFWNEYMQTYNACFYEMRKELEIEPYHFYSDYSQMENKAKDTFLYLQNNELVGAVSCFGKEIDDLIVNPSFQRNGWGKQLLLWGIQHIREQGFAEITLHVAKWNESAVALYEKEGFRIRRREKIR